MRKLILKNHQSPGDILMLTATVRDLHACYPGEFLTDVRTSADQLWQHNPRLTPLQNDDPEVITLQCNYPLIHRSNESPYHFVEAFTEFLNDKLSLHVVPQKLAGEIHLHPREKAWISQVQERTKTEIPFWVIAAGGKYDFTAKWWNTSRYQEVVDYFHGKIQFVQVGELHHYHPPLRGVIDLRGLTDIRQLVRLVYHAQGVVCGVTFLMHLAAAVETKAGRELSRPCVVVAGGREPPQWEAYPHHQFLHTVGALSCCEKGGCWKSRTLPMGDGSEKDAPRNLCVDVVDRMPRCMDMISSEDVIRAIERYFQGGRHAYLTSEQFCAAQPAVRQPSAQSISTFVA
jgi:ADP-heptose:LPS heptosyltransferase